MRTPLDWGWKFLATAKYQRSIGRSNRVEIGVAMQLFWRVWHEKRGHSLHGGMA